MAGSPEHTQLHPRVLKGLSAGTIEWVTIMHGLLQQRHLLIFMQHIESISICQRSFQKISASKLRRYLYIHRIHCFPLGICSVHCTTISLIVSVSVGNSRGNDDIKDDHTIILSLCKHRQDATRPSLLLIFLLPESHAADQSIFAERQRISCTKWSC